MAKVLLVEDDTNLREIYEARLMAEGYEIVHANDGEEALVVAKKELPDLVISDVMMPRISGFEMLDIMRNTDGLQNVKVIMLTALGQAEDKGRADKLGADRYLVKSQVTLEDIVKAASELLGEGDATADAPPAVAALQQEVSDAATSTDAAAVPAQAPQPAEAPQAPQTSQAPQPTAPNTENIPVAAPPAENQAAPATAPQQPAPDPAAAPQAPANPPQPNPAEQTQNTSNTEELNDAVNNLINGSDNNNGGGAPQQPAADQNAAPPTPAAQPQQPAAETPQQPAQATDNTANANDDADNDSVTINRKKVIKPLNPEVTSSQSGLDELLAQENTPATNPAPQQPGATNPAPQSPQTPQASAPPASSTQHAPGQVIAPAGNQAAQQQPPTGNPPVDPNSIAL